ncbi:Uu.00g107820.m01.CDS01 [Anthostomella pinea]|uniref:cutinase n=1 Tax=Anthostomella pinea TaxID=933095 RepID=A0AAI8YFX7_9PEZI|nr:Uu.00g107820.m01.CDS01 [Anthostomella pinea]
MKASLALLPATLAVASANTLTISLTTAEIDSIKAGHTTNIVSRQSGGLVPRQSGSTTANEFLDGGCRDLIFIFARGSTQAGNIGDDPGPQVIAQLKVALGDTYVAAQGFDYPALLIDNLRNGGCDPADAADMLALINQAASECPDSAIAVSGYSQGAALVHASVEDATTAVKNQIVAAVTFGDTQRQQDGDQIPNFDTGKTLILCHDGDEVCDGTLIITAAHGGYDDLAPEAVDFIVSKV